MRIIAPLTVLANVRILVPAAVIGGVLAMPTLGGGGGPEDPAKRPAAQPHDSRFAPYASDEDHLWNRLHQAMFVREAPDRSRRVHSTDPLLYQGITRNLNGELSFGSFFLLEGESQRRAIELLDQFLAESGDQLIDNPLRRLFLQRDMWAAFDYAAWYPDDWVYHTRHESAALALRTRLAKVIGRLVLSEHEFDALPDNYALAVKSKQYPAAHDLDHPERLFLPADLFDPSGPWVRFHETTGVPMAQQHFEGAGGRAAHVIFLRLPGGRPATEQYLRELNGASVKQFPPGTMVAMIRRALAVNRSAKVRVTPVTELVQIRVYRRIPEDPKANLHGDFGEQDVYEFVMDRTKLFAGQHGLREVGPDDPAESFSRGVGEDPFDPKADRPIGKPEAQLKACIQCHQSPGVYSVMSMQRGLRGQRAEVFRTFDWDVEMNYTVRTKVKQFNWGLLQGMLEAR